MRSCSASSSSLLVRHAAVGGIVSPFRTASRSVVVGSVGGIVSHIGSSPAALRRLFINSHPTHAQCCFPSVALRTPAVRYSSEGSAPILVETNDTPNPDCLRFYSMQLSFLEPGFAIDIPTRESAHKSPLAEHLYNIDGVTGVFLADEYVTLTKKPDVEWEDLTPRISECIIAFAESGQNILSASGEAALNSHNDDTEPEDDDDEVVLAVKELLASRIRPMLRGDGGNVRYIDMDDGTVFVMLEGACKSCPSSGVTLKSGIERMLMHWIPEVVEVQECSDDVADDILAEKALRRKLAQEEALGQTPPIVRPADSATYGT